MHHIVRVVVCDPPCCHAEAAQSYTTPVLEAIVAAALRLHMLIHSSAMALTMVTCRKAFPCSCVSELKLTTNQCLGAVVCMVHRTYHANI